MREVSVYFPERGIRDVTQQLRTLGLIASKSKSTVARFFYCSFTGNGPGVKASDRV